METLIYFVRHAEPDFSIKDDMTRPLTQKGMEDAKKVATILADKGITKVYSSPYKRSVDTIKAFAESNRLEITTHDNLRERSVGAWVEDFKAYSSNQWADFDYKLDGGECLREVQKRNIQALLELMETHKGQHIAIATHGTALCTILNHFKPEFGYKEFWAMVDKMPYILCLKFDGAEFKGIEEIELI